MPTRRDLKTAHHAQRVPTRWVRIGIPVVLILIWLVGGSIGGPYFGKVDEVSSNDQSSYLPQSADATEVSERLPGLVGPTCVLKKSKVSRENPRHA